MQSTSASYKTEIKKPSRSFECRVTIGKNIYLNEDIVDIILETPQPQDGFSIGATTSQTLDLTLINKGEVIYSTNQIKVEIGLKVGATIEYILMGLYNIDEVIKTDYTTKFTAFDNMIKFEAPYFSNLGNAATLQQIVNELATMTGIQFTGSLPSYNLSKLEKFTCREILSYVASICGGNAFITRDGKFTIVYPKDIGVAITGDNYIDYKREEVNYKIGKVSCQVGEKIIEKGSLGTDSMDLQFENPWVTESILTDIYNKVKTIEYLGYTMKWQGDLSLDIGDIITCTDIKGIVRKLPILSQKISYTGGLTSEIGAKGETKNKNSFSSSGSNSNKVNRVVTDLLIANEAIINKANIKDLEATNIRTQTLEAKTATIEKAIIDVAYITDLNALNGNITNLVAEDARINTALINKANIVDLNAVKGHVDSLTANVADIDTLVNGNLSSENIQVGGITGSSLNMDTIFVKDANMINVNISSLKTGDISTNKFRIKSASGNMLIADNTIQIRDSSRVRVQIGKDASNDYNMYVWDSTGKLMFDATGLKADGIKNKIIRDDMISDNANISGGKINISSLVTSINNGATTINSSRVQLDGTNQTLDVAFSSLKTEVQGIEIGGRNLAINTTPNNLNGYGWYSANGAIGFFQVVDEPFSPSKKALKIEYTKAGIQGMYMYRFSKPMEVGKTYTWRVFVRASKVVKISIGVEVDGGRKEPTLSTEWIEITHTFTCTNKNGQYVGVQFYPSTLMNIGDKLYICGFKLEEGTKFTDWTPAIEDIDGDIAAVKEITTSNSTTIGVMQGQISTAINNTQIVKDGKTILLKDDYNRIVQTVNSTSETIGRHESTINANTGAITNVTTEVTEVKKSLTGITQRVGSSESNISTVTNTANTALANASIAQTQANKGVADALLASNKAGQVLIDAKAYTNAEITTVTNKVTSANSEITQLKNQIALKVEATDIITSISNINIGGRNLMPQSNFVKDISWIKNTNTKYSYLVEREGIKSLYGGRLLFVDTAQSATDAYVLGSEYIQAEASTTYTFSLDYWGAGALIGNSSYIYFYKTDKTPCSTLHTQIKLPVNAIKVRKRYSDTITTPVDCAYVKVRVGFVTSAYGWVVYDGMKLEKGNKVTDWSPAPEDIDKSIADTITINTTNIDSAKTEIALETKAIRQSVSTVDGRVTTINGTITSMETRLKAAEVKITNDAIISTVQATINTAKTDAINSANSTTTGKLNSYSTTSQMNSAINQSATGIRQEVSNTYITNTNANNLFATKSSVTQSANDVRFEFNSVTGKNHFRQAQSGHSYPNGECNLEPYKWGYSAYMGGEKAYRWSFTGASGRVRFLKSISKNGVYSVSFWARSLGGNYPTLTIDLCDNSHFQAYSFKSEWVLCKYENITVNNWTDELYHFLDINCSYTESLGWNMLISNIMINEGAKCLPWSENGSEVVSGKTYINADGVTIYDGAITVKNTVGETVLEGDSNGNLSFKGRLQPYDNTIKLFGENCRIDGSSGAIRLQYNPYNYVSVDGTATRFFNGYSSNGARYVSVGVNNEGHTCMWSATTMLKLLGQGSPSIQARWAGDDGYCTMAASAFTVASRAEYKENIHIPEEIDFIEILKSSEIKAYNYKNEVKNANGKSVKKSRYSDYEPVVADFKTGFILDELTDEALKVLHPQDSDGIELYSMCSVLWKVCQDQQNKIEELTKKVEQLLA